MKRLAASVLALGMVVLTIAPAGAAVDGAPNPMVSGPSPDAVTPLTIPRQFLPETHRPDRTLVAASEGTAEPPAPLPPSAGGPLLRLRPDGPLPSRAIIEVEGLGFGPEQGVLLQQCLADDDARCLEFAAGYADTDPDGVFATETAVARTVDGVDCAERAGRCRLVAFDLSQAEYVAQTAIDLTFDPASEVVVPEAELDPATELTDGREVAVSGRRFLAGSPVWLMQCLEGAPTQSCRYLDQAVVDDAGAIAASAVVSRRVGADDCAVATCVVRVMAYPDDSIELPITFDPSAPAPVIPTVTVTPDSGLLDRQEVSITVAGLDGESFFDVRLCEPAEGGCRSLHFEETVQESVSFSATLTRMIGRSDCAVVACEVVVSLFNEGFDLRVPVAFDDSVPPPPAPSVQVDPASDLVDRQAVRVTGANLPPGSPLTIAQCRGMELSADACTVTYADADQTGALSERFTVRRTIALRDEAVDCVVSACHLVVGYGYDEWSGGGPVPTIATALAFDPDGPLVGSDLSAQPGCVPWPTGGWAVGPIPAGVDAAAVERLGAEMTGPGGGRSVVVVHGGRVVYERYADGYDASSVHSSWSVSKSITSTIVGKLVDDGLLALDERAPIPEWSAPDDPRNAITVRHLLNMSSGLQWSEDYSPNPDSDVVRLIQAEDSAGYVIARPFESTPGTRYEYSTGDTSVLGRVIGNTAGVSGPSYEAFLHDELFGPLGIDPVDPHFDPAGNWSAGWRTDTTTRNFAKLGLLYLRDGVWEDEPFLSSDWVEFVRTPAPTNSGYGGHFWLDGDGTFRMYGLLGQTVHIVPQSDLVVAVNHGGSTYGMVDLFRNAETPSCEGPPVATDDAAEVTSGDEVVIDVLANDSGGEFGLDSASVTVPSSPGLTTIDPATGAVTYRPLADAVGTDRFDYRVCGLGAPDQCSSATVTVEVLPEATPDPGPGPDPDRPDDPGAPDRRPRGTLPRTGSEVGGLLELGAALVVLGGGLTFAARRRRRLGSASTEPA